MNYSTLLNPGKLLAAVKSRLDQHARINEAVRLAEARFGSDPNYRIDLVEDNFKPRPGTRQDDSSTLERIVAAYNKAKTDQKHTDPAFDVSNEWLPIYKRKLHAVIEALQTANIPALQAMYQNFFRDACSNGLVGLPVDMQKHYFSGSIQTRYKKYALADSLHRYDLWKSRTANRFPASALSSPLVGNPFGYSVDGVFIRSGADYHHAYATTLLELVGSTTAPVIAELGAGFGGMAYFLLRDRPDVTYVDFDLPEAVALTSYFLMKSLPDRHFTLYGEGPLSQAAPSAPGIYLMPSFEILNMPNKSVAASFNSYSLAEMSPSAIHLYIEQLTRITSGHFLHINHATNAVLTADNFGVEDRGFTLLSKHLAGWTAAINPQTDEFEYLYAAPGSTD